MYNGIYYFNEFGVKSIEKKVSSFLKEGKDIADLVLDLEGDLFELGRNILVEILEDMDEYFRNSLQRKREWNVERRNDEKSLLTSFGEIKFQRTYFRSKDGGKTRHLVDEIVGIRARERVSADVVINVVDEAIDSSVAIGRAKSVPDTWMILVNRLS